jgi:TrmH family RNA methyltransferase
MEINQTDLFLIEGPHLIEMALNSGAKIREVFMTESFGTKKDSQVILRPLSLNACRIFEVTEEIMERIADTKTPQGVAAIVSQKPLGLVDVPLTARPLLVVVDGIQDPGNLGTLIRTSDAAGADAVILLPGTCDAFMQKTIRATAGSIFTIPVVHTDTADLLKWLHNKGIGLAVTSADAKKTVFETDLNIAIAFVFGNEAHGISAQMKKSAEMFIKIPIYGKAESLNVAAASAICLYEAVRQRKQQDFSAKR